jgi:hypothetical protein
LAFELQVRFPGSGFVNLSEHEEHALAYQAMLDHYNSTKRDQPKASGKPSTFEINRVPTTATEVYQVLKTDLTKRYNATGMFCLYRIIERPDEKLSEADRIKLGIVSPRTGEPSYRKGAHRRKSSNGEIEWSEL